MNNKKWKTVKLNQICSLNTLRVNRIGVSVVRVKDDEQVYNEEKKIDEELNIYLNLFNNKSESEPMIRKNT